MPAILKAEPTKVAVVEEVMGFGSGVQSERHMVEFRAGILDGVLGGVWAEQS